MGRNYVCTVWNSFHRRNNHREICSYSVFDYFPRAEFKDLMNLCMASDKSSKCLTQISPLNIFVAFGCLGPCFLNKNNPRLDFTFNFIDRGIQRNRIISRPVRGEWYIIINRYYLLLSSDDQLNNVFSFFILLNFEQILDNLSSRISDG